MTEYKAGDKVIGIKSHRKGETMTVIEKTAGRTYWRCAVGHDGYTALMRPSEIELVKPKSKFKVGDKVRFLNLWTGVGTVIEVDGEIWPVRVEDTNGRTGRFYDAELELAPTHKFKVGDWVEVTGWTRTWDGQVKQIASVPEGGDKYYRFTDESGGFSDKYLKAAKAPKPALEFKKGDIVALKPGVFVYGGLKGKTLIVDHIEDDKVYPYAVRALGEDYRKSEQYKPSELVAGEPLATWEIELLDQRPSLKTSKAAHPSNGKAANDPVSNPAHYGGEDNPYEVIKVAEAWGFEKNAYLFNALKYLARAGKKGNKVEDLNKLSYYVQREIALEEAK